LLLEQGLRESGVEQRIADDMIRRVAATALGSITLISGEAEQAPMGPIERAVARGLTFVLIAAAATGNAQTIESGVGIICDSPAHVEQVIAARGDSRSTVEQVNAESKARVCEVADVAFLVGGIVSEASNDQGVWQIRKVLIVGLILGRVTSPVHPYEKYTAFKVSKTSPI
jgi:hypothetical protein